MKKIVVKATVALMAFFVMQGVMAEEIVALKCGSLLDVTQQKTVQNVTVTIEKERISSVVKNGTVPPGSRVIDLSDKVCMPGLMDMHVHPTVFDGKHRHVSATDSSAFLVLNAVRSVQKLLEAGFTTLRIPGEQDHDYGMIDLEMLSIMMF